MGRWIKSNPTGIGRDLPIGLYNVKAVEQVIVSLRVVGPAEVHDPAIVVLPNGSVLDADWGAPHHQGIVTAPDKYMGRRRMVLKPEGGILAVPTEGLHVVHDTFAESLSGSVIVVDDDNPIDVQVLDERISGRGQGVKALVRKITRDAANATVVTKAAHIQDTG